MMIQKIKAFTLLLTFMLVLSHMMIPHHHHESLVEIKKNHHSHISHTHHHGSQYHEHEKQDSDNQDTHDSKLPQHFHLSTSDGFEPLRLNSYSQELSEHTITAFVLVDFLSWESSDSFHILKYPKIWPEKTAKTQHEPGAISLRGPPAFA